MDYAETLEALCPPVNARYGAPLGRQDDEGGLLSVLSASDPAIRLIEIPIDDQGYDPGGAYWGLGEPLFGYRVVVDEDEGFGFIRAPSREAAEGVLTELCPDGPGFEWLENDVCPRPSR